MNASLAVCVFCASSQAVDPVLRQVAGELGQAIAAEGWSLVYGGGSVGLMGEVASAALDAGAPVTGIIPRRLADREIALLEVTELVVTDTMRERKALMDERSDAFVVLPGGIGTLEELMEILTLKQLGYHRRAIVLLDPHDYWRPLCEQLERMVEEGLSHADTLRLFQLVKDVPAAVEALATYEPPLVPAGPVTEMEALESFPEDAAGESDRA